MKKFGILIFVIAAVVGLIVTNIFSVGASNAPSFPSFSLSFGGFRGIKGSGDVVTQKRDLSGFKAVDVGGIFEVEITAGKEFAVEVQADDNLLEHIRTEVRGGVLHIETSRKINSKSTMRILVSAPEINDLDISGVAKVNASGLNADSLNVDASGASKVNLSGRASKLTVDVSGATKIDAEALSAVDVNVDASGASSVMVNVSGTLRGDASGASKIVYAGSPTEVKKSTSGASRVSLK
jgi:hypothetical protein